MSKKLPKIPKNRYFLRSNLSEKKFRQIVRLFAYDLPASKVALMSSVNRNTVNLIFRLIRERILLHCQNQSPLTGEVEADESYFGPKRVKGKRGRGAGRKTIVFGLLKREGKVFTQIVPDCKKKTLQDIIRGKVKLASVIHSDGWPGYDGLVDVGYAKHFRVEHGKDIFVKGKSHVNGIESFWSFAKRRLAKFNGVPTHTFLLHLKETEFRFNSRKKLYRKLLSLLRNNPLKNS